MTDCLVCTNPFSKSARKPISCEFCPYVACLTCVKTYLLQTVHQPHCMNCRKEWTLDMLNARLSQSFLKDEYRKMRETVLFEEEKTHLPALQAEAERLRTIERLEIQMLDLEQKKHENHLKEDQLVSTQREVHRELTRHTDELYAKQLDLRHNRQRTREKKEFIMKCPLNECRGFLSAAYKCGLCDTAICKDCHKSKGEDHQCHADDVATITELVRTTKPCPKCHCRIYKTDGCDQMFCIQCHTAFSWRTGEIESGVIHNPHYFEALRAGNIRDPRHRQDHGACGPMPTFYIIRQMFRKEVPSIQERVTHIYQEIAHHRAVTLARLVIRENRETDRVKYLLGQLEEKKFKQHIYVYHQTTLRKQEEHQILDSYVTIGEELFRSMTMENVKSILDQLLRLQAVTYDAIVHIDKKYVHKGGVSTRDIRVV